MTNPIWVIKTRLCLQYTGSPAAVTQAPQYKGMIGKKEGNLDNLTFAKTYGTVTRDRKKNWPIADWRVPSNNPRNNCGTHFSSSSLVVSKVVNERSVHVLGEWFEKFRPNKFHSGIGFTICFTNQFHLPKNSREGLKLVSKIRFITNVT